MGKPTVGDMYIRQYQTVDIPQANDDEIQNFLMQVYKEKDELIDTYLKTRGHSFRGNNNFNNPPVSILSFIQHEGRLMAGIITHGIVLSVWLLAVQSFILFSDHGTSMEHSSFNQQYCVKHAGLHPAGIQGYFDVAFWGANTYGGCHFGYS